MIPDKVAVLLSARVEAGVEFRRRFGGGYNPDLVWKEGIDGEGDLWERYFELGTWYLDVCDHSERMHPSVGPAGTMDALNRGKKLSDRLLDLLLDANSIRLDLPPGVI